VAINLPETLTPSPLGVGGSGPKLGSAAYVGYCFIFVFRVQSAKQSKYRGEMKRGKKEYMKQKQVGK
jgi:hypothetical protein